LRDSGVGYLAVVNDHKRQFEELLIVPMSDSPASNGRPDPSYDDRRGRLVVVGLVMALLFLLIAALVWWASDADGERGGLLVPESPSVPNSIAASARPAPPPTSRPSTLPLTSYPMPAIDAVPPSTEPAPPVESQPPASPAPIAQLVSVTTTTTTLPPTTTVVAVAPPPTVAPTTTVARTTDAPSTSSAPTTTTAPTTVAPTTTVADTTTVPSTTVPGPVVTSPADPDATLLDVIESTPDLARLRELVDAAGLHAELADAAPRTFFAPSNDAIDTFATSDQGGAVLADPELLRQLLLRHLVPDALDEPAIFSNDRLDTLAGDSLVVRQGSHTVDGADLVVVDVVASNGYLHLVSDVLTGSGPSDGS
jgi:uncharacterized surface protein with fasciclin (FAS1) repeats